MYRAELWGFGGECSHFLPLQHLFTLKAKKTAKKLPAAGAEPVRRASQKEKRGRSEERPRARSAGGGALLFPEGAQLLSACFQNRHIPPFPRDVVPLQYWWEIVPLTLGCGWPPTMLLALSRNF